MVFSLSVVASRSCINLRCILHIVASSPPLPALHQQHIIKCNYTNENTNTNTNTNEHKNRDQASIGDAYCSPPSSYTTFSTHATLSNAIRQTQIQIAIMHQTEMHIAYCSSPPLSALHEQHIIKCNYTNTNENTNTNTNTNSNHASN